ncbi:Dna-directed Rna polymerase I RPA2, partial [Cardiosporidium cionae]
MNDGLKHLAMASPIEKRLSKKVKPTLPNASPVVSSVGTSCRSNVKVKSTTSRSLLHSELYYNENFLEAVWPHIRSFNTFLDVYINEIIKELPIAYVDPLFDPELHELNPFYTPQEYLKIGISDITVGYPIRSDTHTLENRLYPRYCRNAHISYNAPLWVTFTRENTKENHAIKKRLLVGRLPIIVKSKHCHLEGLSSQEMIEKGEDMDDPGGYFILNGHERIIRFVIQSRCNYPIALKNARYSKRDIFSTDYAIYIRGQRLGFIFIYFKNNIFIHHRFIYFFFYRYDGTSTANILFYTIDGKCTYRLLVNRQEWLCPFWILLRSLVPNFTTEDIRKKLMEGCWNDPQQCIDFNILFEDIKSVEIPLADIEFFENRYLHQLGKLFWNAVASILKPGSGYEDAGRWIISKHVLVHIE